MRPLLGLSLLSLTAPTFAGVIELFARQGRQCPRPGAIISTTTVTAANNAATVTSTVTQTQTQVQTVTATPAIAAIGNVQGQGQGQGQVLPASCLTDPQAQSIVSAFSNMVTNKDRSSIGGVADGVLAGEFLGMSGSWNSVLGKPASDITSGSKDAYVQAMQGRNAVPMMTDLDVFHDCNNIVWYWAASGVGSGQNEVRGMTLLYTVPSAGGSGGVVGGVVNTVNGVLGGNGRTPDMSVDRYGGRRVNMVMEEFNNLAWMEDEGRNLC